MTVIEVTDHDIANGIPRDCCYCAVSLALRRAFPEAYRVSVTPTALVVGGRPYHTPPLVAAFVRRFDAGKAVQPFRFAFDPAAVAVAA